MAPSCEKLLNQYRFDKLYLQYLIDFYNKKISKNSLNNLLFIDEDMLTIETRNRLVETCIDKLPFPYKDVLRYRYIEKISYENIATIINYSPQRIFQVRNKAILLFSEEFKKMSNK